MMNQGCLANATRFLQPIQLNQANSSRHPQTVEEVPRPVHEKGKKNALEKRLENTSQPPVRAKWPSG